MLTHGHFDHVGAARELADRWQVSIYAHTLELPYLTGCSSYPPPDPTVGGGLIPEISRFFPRGPVDLGDRVQPLPADGRVPSLLHWRWLHTPGHTTGHISLFRDADKLLIAGDAFVTTRQESLLSVLTNQPVVSRPPAYFTSDWAAARRSVNHLARLLPEAAITGHGPPMHGPALRHGLQELDKNFEAEMPHHGRYVRESAVTDEQGVVWVPPPVRDRKLLIAAGLGLRTHRRLAAHHPPTPHQKIEPIETRPPRRNLPTRRLTADKCSRVTP